MLKTLNVQEIIEKDVVRFGNGSIVYTPKRWIGRRALVILEKKPYDISAEVIELLRPYLGDVEGVFLFGSRARGEQTETSDIDILVIAGRKIGLRNTGTFDFLVKTREGLIGEMKRDPTLFLKQIVSEAKPILNASLLEELREVRAKPEFGKFLADTLGAFRKTREVLHDRGKNGQPAGISTAVYSLMLRLKTLFLIQCHKKGIGFSNRKFRQMITGHGFSERIADDLIEVYRAERAGKGTAAKIPLSEAEKLFEAAKAEFLKTEGLARGAGK